jgi:putative hydrolase of the HAD superfamily
MTGRRTSASPEGILVDVEGVLRVWDLAEVAEIERRYGVPVGSLEAVARAPERLGPALLGHVPDEQWRTSVAAALVPVAGDVSRAIDLAADWGARLGRVDEAAAALIAQLRAELPVGFVANATTRFELDLVLLGLADAADAIVSSARAGVAQPDAAIYQLAAGMLGVAPEGCLYVSCEAAHVAGAERVGMRGHAYHGVAALRALLSGMLLLGR